MNPIKRAYKWSPVVFNAVAGTLLVTTNVILNKNGVPTIDSTLVAGILAAIGTPVTFASVTPNDKVPVE